MEEIRSKLNELVDLKAPGVSGSRIRTIQQISTAAADSEASQLGQTIVDFNKEACPVTHKLAVLYVWDAVARALPEGSTGLESLRQQLEPFFSDLKIRHQTPDTFDKMSKVLQIWQKADTFSAEVLNSLKSRYFFTPYSRSPPGSPGPNYFWGGLDEELKPKSPSPPANSTPAAPVNAASVLATLANLAKTAPNNGGAQTSAAPAAAPVAPSLLDQLMSKVPSASPQPASASLTSASSQAVQYQPRGRSAQPVERQRERSRSPDARRRTGSKSPEQKSKIIEIDQSLVPANSIKVLSRTMFVGNIPSYMDDRAVRQCIDDVCPVQSLIFNKEKRHAFIKVYTRADAVNVRETWERKGRSQGFELRARWGVGYGPRDCFDYSKGVSIIPIDRLTEADVRWALTAENGGTGNVPLAGGQVMEEPDIEVGGGLSSRAVKKPAMPMMGMPGMAGIPTMPGMPGMPTMPGMPGMPTMPGMPMPGGNAQFPMMFPGMMPGMPFPFMPGQDMSKMLNGGEQRKEES